MFNEARKVLLTRLKASVLKEDQDQAENLKLWPEKDSWMSGETGYAVYPRHLDAIFQNIDTWSLKKFDVKSQAGRMNVDIRPSSPAGGEWFSERLPRKDLIGPASGALLRIFRDGKAVAAWDE